MGRTLYLYGSINNKLYVDYYQKPIQARLLGHNFKSDDRYNDVGVSNILGVFPSVLCSGMRVVGLAYVIHQLYIVSQWVA